MKSEFLALQKKIYSLPQSCYIEGCDNVADFNHLLQRNGRINQISENGCIYELTFNNHYSPPIKFESRGVKKSFGYKGFCGKHDNDLFKPIEGKNLNFYEYKNQLLFVMRAFYNQRYKKERLLLFYQASKRIENLKNVIAENYFVDAENGLIDALNCYEKLEKEIFHDYNHGSQHFYFKVIELPFVEVCISSFFTYETSEEIREMYLNNNQILNEPLTDIFINFIPDQTKSILIIGCRKKGYEKCEDYLSMFDGDSKQVLKLISNIMLNNVEDWIISPRFFQTKIEEKESLIVEILSEQRKNERRNMSINLFE